MDEQTLNHSLERHIQSVIQVVIVSLLLWVGNSILSMRDNVTVMQVQYAQAIKQIEELKTEVTGLKMQINASSIAAANAATAAANAATAAASALEKHK